MKKKVLFSVGIGALMLFGLAGNVSTKAKADQIRNVSTVAAVQEEQNLPKGKGWTASKYKKWISEQRKELEPLIGTGSGWCDEQGVFHEWTKESVDEQIKKYEENLKDIQLGIIYSKSSADSDDGTCYVQSFPNNDDTSSSDGIDIVTDDGNEIHIGDYESEKE